MTRNGQVLKSGRMRLISAEEAFPEHPWFPRSKSYRLPIIWNDVISVTRSREAVVCRVEAPDAGKKKRGREVTIYE